MIAKFEKVLQQGNVKSLDSSINILKRRSLYNKAMPSIPVIAIIRSQVYSILSYLVHAQQLNPSFVCLLF